MENLDDLELRDEKIFPDEKVLRNVLGKSFAAYALLIELFRKNAMTFEWRYYRDGKAWLCKVQKQSRTIIWMSAWKGFMRATIYFPGKYLEKVYQLEIGEESKRKIRLTKNVGQSKPCTFEVRDEQILTDLTKVMQLKIECK